MKFSEFVSLIKLDLRKYDEMGLVDDYDILRWVVTAMKSFGNNIMVNRSELLYVDDEKRVDLPLGFFKLKGLFLCTPKKVKVSEDKADLFINAWYEKGYANVDLDICSKCVEPNEKYIVEKYVFDFGEAEVYYSDVEKLYMQNKRFDDICDKDCVNTTYRGKGKSFYIEGNSLFTDFSDAFLFMLFSGLPYRDGELYIYDSPNGLLLDYLTTYVKFKFFESLLINEELPNISNLFQYYAQMERDKKAIAMTELKFNKIRPKDFVKIANRNKLRVMNFEKMLPDL